MKNVILLEIEEYEKLMKCKQYVEHQIVLLEKKVQNGEEIGLYMMGNRVLCTELEHLKHIAQI